jgi:hypothetical protein
MADDTVEWGARFPLWQSTVDGRRIIRLTADDDAKPLLLMPVDPDERPPGAVRYPFGPYHVGYIYTVTFEAGRKHAHVIVTGRLIRELIPDLEWFLAPDIGGDLRSVSKPTGQEISGRLVGGTLVHRPSWPDHHPVVIAKDDVTPVLP